MIDAAHPGASLYLWTTGTALAVLFAIPLLLVPLRWARAFRWRFAGDQEVAVYFGRCLGACAAALSIGTLRAAHQPAAYPLMFELTIFAGALLTIVHVIGALEGAQPWTETAEIPFWAALTVTPALIYRDLFA
jgi:hypothetical protein